MFKHWYEKLTFGIAMVCLFLWIFCNNVFFIFYMLFMILWLLATFIPIKEEVRR